MLTKKKIIEQQKALISDLREANERDHMMIRLQHKQILSLIEENNALKAAIKATDIDFPNSEKGGLEHTGEVNVSDILNL